MIDLTKKGLPDAIMVNGKPISINTDFRCWIRFNHDYDDYVQGKLDEIDISYLFPNVKPNITNDVLNQLLMFLYNPPVTPKADGTKSEKIFDYMMDGDYIFSALYAEYGIDITSMDMHWHKFQALVINVVGDNTLFGLIRSYRSYEKPSKNHSFENDMLRKKEAYALPISDEFIDPVIEEFNEYFEGGD